MNSKYETKVIRIHTEGDNKFGFTLVGQYPCQLVRIQHGSPAQKAGIRSGDEIIEVNGVNVEDLKHDCVATFITPTCDGVTELRVRRISSPKTLKSGHNVLKSVSEVCTKNRDDLSHVVDRVVERFKPPDAYTTSPQKGLDLSVLNSNDIASDEQLKATFSPVRVATNSSLSGDISTPITPSLKLNSKNNTSRETPQSVKVLVGYLGSLKRPIATKTSLGLVTHLCVRQNTSAWVVLEIGSTGIYLRNSNKQIIMMSPLNSLVYFGVCRENKQMLALLTADLNKNFSYDVINNHVAITSDCNLSCSCHVFVIEPRFIGHEIHKTLMDSFQLLCDPLTGSCQEYFPTSANTILNALRDILHKTFTRTASTENEVDFSNLNFNGTEVEILRELGVITPQELIKSDHLCSLLSIHESQRDDSETKQVLCLYLQPLCSNFSMKDKELDYAGKEDYNIEICGEEQTATTQQSGSVTLTSHNFDIATSDQVDTYMADKNFLKPHDPGKVAKTGHKTHVHQRSHSLASNVKNTLQAQAAAAAVVAATKTVECIVQDFETGNDVRQIHHASSTSVLAANLITGHEQGKVARWAVAFDRLLEDKTGLEVFRNFLKKEFSEENVIFWLACETYKTLEDEKERKGRAEEIYEQHLKTSACLPVNVDSTAVKDVETNLQDASTELFSSLQYQVYTLMKFDSYTRFLKSELYRECLVNEMEGKPLPTEHQEEEKKEEDEGTSTLKRMFSSTKGKGRKTAPKSQTSTETDDNKKKSILPWRGRLKSEQVKRQTTRSSDSQASSARSSLSSLSDSVFSPNITNSDEALNDSDSKEQGPLTCKVILPNSLSMLLFCKSTRSLKEGLSKICESKEYSLPALDVYLDGQKLANDDLQKKLTRFINKEILLKQKILFRLELPKARTIGIKADDDKNIEEVLEPIFQQDGLDIKEYDICLRVGNQLLSPSSSVSLLHQKHVVAREKSINNVPIDVKPMLTAQEHFSPTKSITAIDHKVFENIMLGKRQSMSGFCFDDTGVFVPMVKLHAAGSRESLTVAGKEKERQMPRSPALFRKKKRNVQQSVPTFQNYIEEDRKNTEEFFVLLHRSQKSRIDDQRGLLDQKNIELPDFLKIQEIPAKLKNPLSVGVPSPRPAHAPLKKTTSSPPSYVSNQQATRPPVVPEESRETLSRFTRNWSGSALGRGRINAETVTETQTIDRRRFFKHPQNEHSGRLRAESLPYTHPDDRCNDVAGVSELRTRTRYHYESETSLNDNKNSEVVWVSNSLSKNRLRRSAKTDTSGSGDAGYESTTDDEGVSRRFPKTEVIIPHGNTKTDRIAVSGTMITYGERSNPGSHYFRENMATAKHHVRTLAEQSGNDRQAILDNSFLRDELKPSRLFSQLSPEVKSPPVNSSPKDRNGTPRKCPLFIPPGSSYSTVNEVTESVHDNHVKPASMEPRVCWEANEPKDDDGSMRVTFV